MATATKISTAYPDRPTCRQRKRQKMMTTTMNCLQFFVAAIVVIETTITVCPTLHRSNGIHHVVVDAFTTTTPTTTTTSTSSRRRPSHRTHITTPLLSRDENDASSSSSRGPEKSRMNEFARIFLDKMNQGSDDEDSASNYDDIDSSLSPGPQGERLEDIADATHLVAIPLDQAHELLIELESVQRAILYHCPTLVDACIPPAAVRLPLLYVQSPGRGESGGSNDKSNDGFDALVTSRIGKVVQKLVDKHVFTSKRSTEGVEEGGGGGDYDDNDDEVGLNDDGYLPLSLTFQSLEIDGDNNNLLHTVGIVQDYDVDSTDPDGDDRDEDVGIFNYNSPRRRTSRLHDFVSELDLTLRSMGFKTAFPHDPQSQKPGQDKGEGDFSPIFRPRVSFMELPKSVDEKITHFKSPGTEIEEDMLKFLTPEEGGNGISPIFFCRWWDDVFGRNIRLREVGVYPRNPFQTDDGLRLSSQFFLPYETISLPDGNQNMIKSEKKFKDYQDQRMKEAQEKMENEMKKLGESRAKESDNLKKSAVDAGSARLAEPDILMKKTRDRLERIYLESTEGLLAEVAIDSDEVKRADDVAVDYLPPDDVTKAGKIGDEDSSADCNDEDSDRFIDDWKDRKVIQSDDDYIDDWMKKRIKEAVESLESEKSRKPVKKVKPPIEENPVFKAYKEGNLNIASEIDIPKSSSAPKFGPYPGKDHFVGIWRVVKSPTGFDVDDTKEDSSENIVLRVDGTIAGGPTLDLETKQKAAGGIWKMLVDDDGTVRLRIRLVIPPKKERIMVMEGVVDRIGSDSHISMASKAFGIPHLEALAKRSEGDDSVQLMLSTGQVCSTCFRKFLRIPLHTVQFVLKMWLSQKKLLEAHEFTFVDLLYFSSSY